MDWVVILIYIVGIIIAGALIYFVPKTLFSWFGMEIGEEGCFIATAAYGTSVAEEIDVLRGFRDDILYQSLIGEKLVRVYYNISLPFAHFVAERDSLKKIVRKAIIEPVIKIIESLKR